ncbi:helix-turn-helix transcriptional regulator [Dyella acidisoli]|uniref:helix-turn-helix transcriptional regulator n=1 Tax=Dyella acidisoli TaxID=1867834 RepID=UPI0024E0B066|nr:AlpA family transcriptional regulator [Dyella acidisoli]
MTHAAALTPTSSLLRLPAVLARVGISRATLYRWMRQDQFPRPRSLTPNGSTVAWLAAEVEAWITSKPTTSGGTFGGAISFNATHPA